MPYSSDRFITPLFAEDKREKRNEEPEMPEPPGLPDFGISALMAVLAGLANNRFRPNDDPYQAFLYAYEKAANAKYQRELEKWRKKRKVPVPEPNEDGTNDETPIDTVEVGIPGRGLVFRVPLLSKAPKVKTRW